MSDRIIDFVRVPAKNLRANPKNWRQHPEEQRTALRAMLDRIGVADAVLARGRPDGDYELLDGHLRVEVTDPDELVPVLVLDLDDAEADELLLTHDALTLMAEPSEDSLRELLRSTQLSEVAGLEALLAMLDDSAPPPVPAQAPEPVLTNSYQVVIECEDEAAQRVLYDELVDRGLNVKVLTL